MARNRPNQYREIFFAEHGFGPFNCNFCNLDVEFDDVTVHHIDHNRSNNSIGNLIPVHDGCHMRHHNSGKLASERAKARWKRVPIEQKRKVSKIANCIQWNMNRGKSCVCGEHQEEG